MADINHDTADDAFHEIQLSGKQLVFLFMATTVISVIIFLCGVLVGRGVRAEAIGADPGLTSSAESASVPEPAVPAAPPSAAPAPPTEGQLGYARRLESQQPTAEKADPPRAEEPSPRVETPEPRPATPKPSEAPRAAAAPARPAESPVASPAAQGARPGTWIVQVVSLRDRAAAAQLVQRLKNKGYPAFLVAPAPGGPTQLYKVQVGRYGDRTEAQEIQARLKREEQFDPWIVR